MSQAILEWNRNSEELIIDIREDIVSRFKNGENRTAIALSHNKTLDFVDKILQDENLFQYDKVEVETEKIKQIALLLQTGLAIHKIAKEVGMSERIFRRYVHQNYTKNFIDTRQHRVYAESKKGDKNPMKGKYGESHHNFKGLIYDKDGYLMRLKPDWFEGSKKYVTEHTLVFCQYYGLTKLPKKSAIHHIDKDKTNNNIDNLALTTYKGHTRLHARMKKL